MRRLSSLIILGSITLGTLSVCKTGRAAPDPTLVKRGEYLATAADCGACHDSKEKGLMAGGLALHSPTGDIFAPNITPDKKTGIGSWTETQFADALRKGTSPTLGTLYPAMPYTAYNGLTDEDIHALYSYFMLGVPAIDNVTEKTELPFPFYRITLPIWKLLFNKPYKIDIKANSPQIERGRYLVDHLEHCSTCHTPRNIMLAEKHDSYLAGGRVWPWSAPNITPSQQGIGEWSRQDIKDFLTKGHNRYAVAGGEMGLAVQQSLSHLTNEDLDAITAYLKVIPTYSPSSKLERSPFKKIDHPDSIDEPQIKGEQLLDDHSLDGARLYQGACAACHGIYGEGSKDAEHPSLLYNDTVRMKQPDNLINVISKGIHYRGVDGEHSMPGFSGKLSDKQIASLTNYVRVQFSNQDSQITEKYIKKLSISKNSDYLIVKYARLIIVLATICIVMISIVVLLWNRKKGDN